MTTGLVRALALVACALGCSASKDPSDFGSEDAVPAGSSGSDSGGPGSGAGGALGIGGGTGSGQGGMETCAADSYVAEGIPLDMLLVVDQSGSMDDEVMGGTRWSAVTKAIEGFVSQSPDTDGIGVGLGYFPLPPQALPMCPSDCNDCACLQQACNCTSCTCVNSVCTCSAVGGGASCEPSDYASPEVPITQLPSAKGAIVQSLAAHGPSGGTPTRPALQGAMEHAKAWQANHQDHAVVVVLATDGLPSNGDCVPNDVAAAAAAAASGLPDVMTFVIGVGPALGNLNDIALAGGTQQALLVDTGGDVEQDFIDAMNAISHAAIPCEYFIPEAEGGRIDFEKVNLQFTPPGDKPSTVKYVGSAAGCDATSGGWYYDDPANPTKILVCDATCTTFKGEAKGKVDILIGCKTEIN